MSRSTNENPLDPSSAYEQRIRDRAYYLWLSEGQPHGREADYWERARELEALHMSVGREPNPMIANPDGPPANEVIDEAELQANLGEFPDRFADQGDRQVTPMTREEARKARSSRS